MKLSIIIPIYNPILSILQNTLKSIEKQNFKDYEVIMVVDGEKSFLQSIKDFQYKIPLKIITTDLYTHCAGNSRNIGLVAAQGDWITFIDQDDEFEDNAFKQVFDIIEQQKLKYICCTLLYEYDPAAEKAVYHTDMRDNIDVWLHGKYYNRENLLEKYKIKFKEDLQYLEDLYFNNKVIQTLYQLANISKPTLTYYNIITYKWINYPFATHSSLIEDKYNFNHYGLSNYYCDVVFPFILSLIPYCKTDIEKQTIQKTLFSDLAYLYINYNIISERYGKNDKLLDCIIITANKYIKDIISIYPITNPYEQYMKETIEYISDKDLDQGIQIIPFNTWWTYILNGTRYL